MFLLGWWPATISSQEQLTKIFKFNGADLEANRSGVLSEGQQQRLIKSYTRWTTIFYWIVLYIFACFLINLLTIPLGNRGPGGNLACFAVIGGFILVYAGRLKRDTTHNRVHAVTGMMQLTQPGRSRAIVVHRADSEMQFPFYGILQRDFVSAQPCTVYYIPLTRRIVSVEYGTPLAPMRNNAPEQEN